MKRNWLTVAGIVGMAVLVAACFALPVRAAEEGQPTDPNMVKLDIQLPDPSFSGTPLEYFSEILEYSFKPRPDFFAPKGTEIVSKGKPVTSSDKSVTQEKLAKLVDGDKSFPESSVVTLKGGTQYIQIDLGQSYELYAILMWHFHEYERVYKDVSVKVSDDPEFKENVAVLFNNDHDNSAGLGVGKDKEYIEKAEGRLIDAKGAKGRYVRIYSNGNSTDDLNTYIEVEIWGKA